MMMEPKHERRWTVPGRLGNERFILRELDMYMAETGIGADIAENIKTAVAEAIINAIEHGNGMRDNTTVTTVMEAGPSLIRFRVYDERPLLLADNSGPRDRQRDKDNPRGWGLHLISALSDGWRWGSDEDGCYIAIDFTVDSEGECR